MKYFKRWALVIVLVGLFIAVPSFGKAATIDELQSQINALLAQLATLQQQLAQQGGGQQEWCHTFNTNMRVGDHGDEVVYLQEALEKEGFAINDADKSREGQGTQANVFGDSTAAGVTGFQEKYRGEILTPNGLKYGTGYVGGATRRKLNQLYGCGAGGTTNPQGLSVSYVSPNKNIYAPGENIPLTIKGVELFDGSPGTPAEGFNVQVYLRGSNDSSNLQGVNATYNSQTGYWNAQLIAPTDPLKFYVVESSFYCADGSLVCGERYASGPTESKGQVIASFKFSLSTAPTQSFITVLSPNGGSFSSSNQLSISWTAYSGSFDYWYVMLGNQLANVADNLSPDTTVSKNATSFTATNIAAVTREIVLNSGGKTADQIKDSYYIVVQAVKNDRVGGSIVASASGSYFTITSSNSPTITNISPSQGSANTSVTIYGTNLSGASSVEFYSSGGQLKGSLAPSFVSSQYLTFNINAILAALLSPGMYQVGVVTNACAGGCSSNRVGFILTAPPPPLPTTGLAGIAATLNGSVVNGGVFRVNYYYTADPNGTLPQSPYQSGVSVTSGAPLQSAPTGKYKISLDATSIPTGYKLQSVTPADTQILNANGTMVFTFNFVTEVTVSPSASGGYTLTAFPMCSGLSPIVRIESGGVGSGINLYRCQGAGCVPGGSAIYSGSGNMTITDTNVTPGVTYVYRADAVNTNISSNTVIAIGLNCTPASIDGSSNQNLALALSSMKIVLEQMEQLLQVYWP